MDLLSSRYRKPKGRPSKRKATAAAKRWNKAYNATNCENNEDKNCSETYHPALSSLSWLFGVWESVEAEEFYPTKETTKFKEIVEYLPTMNPALEYKSETWHAVTKTKLNSEKGFLNIDPENSKLALLSANFFGLNEISEGVVEDVSLSLESRTLSKISFSNCADTVKIIRKLWLKDKKLYSTIDRLTDAQASQVHIKSIYKKKV